MPSRNWMFRVQDILDAIEVTIKYIEGMTFDEFAGDQRTVDAVVRRLTIIGEASSHIPVFNCKYCQEPANTAASYGNGDQYGYTTLCTLRPLDQVTETPPPGY